MEPLTHAEADAELLQLIAIMKERLANEARPDVICQ